MKSYVEATKRQENLLSSAIFEMGAIINKILTDKKKRSTLEFLSTMADQHQKGYIEGLTESFIADQTKARAQSNTKKT